MYERLLAGAPPDDPQTLTYDEEKAIKEKI
jgi:hypothetical protein